MVLPYAAASLPFLLLFRLTCYYYRGAYYRSVWQSPTDARWPNRTRNTLVRPGSRDRAEHAPYFYIARVILSVINACGAMMGVPLRLQALMRFRQHHSQL